MLAKLANRLVAIRRLGGDLKPRNAPDQRNQPLADNVVVFNYHDADGFDHIFATQS